MIYQIDQSGKIEQTNINTIIALVNDRNFSLVLRKNDKRILEKMFRKIGKAKSYPYIVFAILLAILLKFTNIKSKVIIDREYMGHENTIRERTLYFLKSINANTDIIIEFGHVGKTSRAHNLAARVGSKKVNPDKVVKIEEVLRLILEVKSIKKTEVDKRLKNT